MTENISRVVKKLTLVRIGIIKYRYKLNNFINKLSHTNQAEYYPN